MGRSHQAGTALTDHAHQTRAGIGKYTESLQTNLESPREYGNSHGIVVCKHYYRYFIFLIYSICGCCTCNSLNTSHKNTKLSIKESLINECPTHLIDRYVYVVPRFLQLFFLLRLQSFNVHIYDYYLRQTRQVGCQILHKYSPHLENTCVQIILNIYTTIHVLNMQGIFKVLNIPTLGGEK